MPSDSEDSFKIVPEPYSPKPRNSQSFRIVPSDSEDSFKIAPEQMSPKARGSLDNHPIRSSPEDLLCRIESHRCGPIMLANRNEIALDRIHLASIEICYSQIESAVDDIA